MDDTCNNDMFNFISILLVVISLNAYFSNFSFCFGIGFIKVKKYHFHFTNKQIFTQSLTNGCSV